MKKSQPTTKKLEDTGERMIPSYHKGHLIYGEHIVRYESVEPFVKNKIVLDIASGSGYGTAKLAETAKHVTGVDLDSDAIAYASENYAAKNIEYKQGDGIHIPLTDNAIDTVVSFETIEHIEDYKQFLSEVKRVLKPEGTLVISSPNDLESPEGNHYHVHEFQFDELFKLLKAEFTYVQPHLQGTWLYTTVVSAKDAKGDWRQEIDTIGVSPLSKEKAMYFQFICSNEPIKQSLKIVGSVSEHWSVRSLQEHNEGVGYLINQLKSTVKEQESQIKKLTKELARVHNTLVWRIAKKAKAVKSIVVK